MNTQSPRVCMVIAYFGKWPAFLDIYLDSCERNKDVLDVLLITDIKDKLSLPSNVKTVQSSLDEISEIILKKLDIQTQNFRPYKLCDLKPAFGVLFQEHITQYDFWGFGDIDVIYGDLKRFMSKRMLDRYDVITYREEWISGALTLIRNKPEFNELFKRSKDYKDAFGSKVNHAFDECGRKHKILRTGIHPLDVEVDYSKNDVECFTQVVLKADEEGAIQLYQREHVKESLPLNEIVWRIGGRLIGADQREYIMFHYVWHKRFSEFHIPKWKKIPDELFITPSGFYPLPTKFWKLKSAYRTLKGKTIDLSKRGKVSLSVRIPSLYRLLFGEN